MLGIYALRVFLINGWYIVTYGLGIYLLNNFIGFLSPQVRPFYIYLPSLDASYSCSSSSSCQLWASHSEVTRTLYSCNHIDWSRIRWSTATNQWKRGIQVGVLWICISHLQATVPSAQDECSCFRIYLQAVCKEITGVQILVRLCQSSLRLFLDDLFRSLWCPCLLANTSPLLHLLVPVDNETTNPAYDQA